MKYSITWENLFQVNFNLLKICLTKCSNNHIMELEQNVATI
nr:MAG TPA: hypothetical protein [Caudoviricetes sp.]